MATMAERILIAGYPGDTTTRHVVSVASGHGLDVDYLDLARFHANGELSFSSKAPARTRVRAGNQRYDLSEYAGIYQRLVLPPPRDTSPTKWPKMHARYLALEASLLAWPGRLVNRPLSGWQNMSKPLQAHTLARHGFLTPPALSTANIADYRAFRAQGDTIFKSNSGVRSIVDNVETVEDERLAFLENCPVLFQRLIRGKDVRVHVMDGRAYAVEIDSDAVDYRYVRTRGTYAHMHPNAHVPPDIAERCASYAAAHGVLLAGFDFKVTPGGEWYCLEMNPAPGFEMYDHVLDGLISNHLLEYLRG
jgi:hypothetical protein